jgi:hypothetical protein
MRNYISKASTSTHAAYVIPLSSHYWVRRLIGSTRSVEGCEYNVEVMWVVLWLGQGPQGLAHGAC